MKSLPSHNLSHRPRESLIAAPLETWAAEVPHRRQYAFYTSATAYTHASGSIMLEQTVDHGSSTRVEMFTPRDWPHLPGAVDNRPPYWVREWNTRRPTLYIGVTRALQARQAVTLKRKPERQK
ncbi:hypothetical protein EYZ11_013336 [Aspergillus tanneri]|uniref:Uncharacterized protein n=1 Tax=Aspergillus tanneri TaxID=1220188 RepID=A0A4S3IXX0_9EURO|nr:hypothetical protein EYZ11_013336 [Aspergillus tanneri]